MQLVSLYKRKQLAHQCPLFDIPDTDSLKRGTDNKLAGMIIHYVAVACNDTEGISKIVSKVCFDHGSSVTSVRHRLAITGGSAVA